MNCPVEAQSSETLRQRARELAKPVGLEEPADLFEVVEFELAGERFALELPRIREVIPLRRLTRVPCTPTFVSGILNVRGRVVSIIDLAVVLQLPERELGEDGRAIIMASEKMEFGILADRIVSIRSVDRASIQPGLSSLNGKSATYTKGVTEDGLAVLDGDRILEDEDLIVHEEVQA